MIFVREPNDSGRLVSPLWWRNRLERSVRDPNESGRVFRDM